MIGKRGLLSLGVGVALSGCVTIPAEPTVMVLPGPGKSFEQFQADDAVCDQWAGQQAGTPPKAVTTKSTATGAASETADGGGPSAPVGAASGHPGVGEVMGAGSGLPAETALGVGASQAAVGTVQWRYDIAYQQCMYAKGNQIPGVAARHASPPRPLPLPPPASGEAAPSPPQPQ